ncbi:MAG: LamG domain-containing protein [Sedimentisphaerales bacterium]|nr:LamG domain-containing protein [Sedimentisphaerales bacterium]
MFKKLIVLTSFLLVMGLVFANAASAATISVNITDENDDVEERLDRANEIDMGSSDVELPYEDEGMGDPQVIGLRYPGIAIPKGSTIISAYVQFQVDETKGGTEPVNVVIEGDLSADAAPFTSDPFTVTSRARTAAQVLWSAPNWTAEGDRGPDQATTDLAAIIQEIVDQPDWAEGNALALIISDDPANPSSGIRCAEAGPGDDSATLVIEFAFEGASAPSPANGEVDVKAAPVLKWTAGATAFQHDLYLGTDADLVAASDASVLQGSLADTSFAVDVNTPLSRGTTYYWKVDVSTGTSRASEFHPGNVWNFRVADENTASWAAAAGKDSPAFIATFVEDGLYDIGALSGDITYEFVVQSNPDEQEASMALIGRRDSDTNNAGIKYEQWNNTGTYGATLFGVVDLDFGVPTSPGEHTVLTFVSSETTNTTALYVNGALAGSVDSAITLSGIVGIGYGSQDEATRGSASFDNFDGTIFGVAIYGEALAEDLIAEHADSYFNPAKEIVPVDPGTEGLVAYYAFENDANDISGNGNDGTIVGDPVFVDGPTGFGTAMEFNGDDYVDCGNGDTLQIQDAITISFWFNVVAFENTWEAFLSKGDSAYRVSRGDGTGDATHFGISGTTGGGGNGWFNGTSIITGGVWHHFAGTYDGAEGRIYIDGVLDATTEASGQINIETENFWIGNNSQNPDRFLHGMMDEVMLYNRALSELEVMYLAGKRVTPVDPGSKGLLALWTCDEGEGAVVGDASGNGRDGAFVFGDPAWVEGVSGTAVELVGPTLIEVPPLGLELSEATMAGWIKPNGVSPDWSAVIMHRGTGLAHGFNMLADFQLAYHWNDDSNSWSFRGGDFIAENDWTFAAVTVAPDKATFYVNGEMGAVNEITHDPAIWDNNIYLGGDGGDTWVARRMNGALDDVTMYSRALSAGEIRYLSGARAVDDVLGDDVTALGDVVKGVPDDGDWPGAETPDLAFDDDVTTKYLHFKGDFDPDPGTGGAGLQITPAAGPTVVTGLTLTTANDVPGRDPIAFELSGSNDSIDGPYTLIASGDIVDFAQAEEWPRFTMNATPIMFDNDVAYTHYQLIFTAIRGPVGGSVNSMQIAEVELRTSKY